MVSKLSRYTWPCLAWILATVPLSDKGTTALAAGTSAQDDDASEGRALRIPLRRPPDAPPGAPPSLPVGATGVKAATLHLVIRRDTARRPSSTRRQIVSRTSDRIHIAGNDGREWLFERNPLDPRRVAATAIEHESRAIVLYEESDLRMTLGIRGWADVLTLGFDSQLLSGYERTRDVRTIGGIRFVRHARAGARATRDDVWWSDDQALASHFAIADAAGVTRFAVERASAGVDAELLRAAIVRFPDYRVVDLADWQEKR
jgi:hypothetical protein